MAASPASELQWELGTGPLFGIKDRCAYIKVRKDDSTRAVVDLTTMTLVDYATPEQYPVTPLRCDRSLFVPIFCTECYGTRDLHYKSALENITSSNGAFIVGVCSVYGVATDEIYPDSRREYIVPNDLAFSGACHPMPGKALFMHKAENDIGFVKCYWHVHSRSTNKTFLYCCVARADTEYAVGVVKPETTMGFSLGTIGDNAKGPITEECSLVSWPMRPGCFCVVVSPKDLASTMTRMGFSTVKSHTLEAGENPLEPESDCVNSVPMSSGEQTVEPDNNSLSKMLSDQLAEIRVLKDMLEAVKVQNNLFTRLLKGPDKDALFTLRGAKDFSRRTGTETKLCAGDTTDTIQEESQHVSDTYGVGDMAATQAQMDELLKLLQKQQHPQQHEAQPANLYAAHNPLQLSPFYLPYQQLQPQHPASFYRRDGSLGIPDINIGAQRPVFEKPANQQETLTAEQRREIAMAYNREEAEKQAVVQKQQEQMIESIKASIRDALKEQSSQKSGTAEPQSEQYEMLRMLAKDTPYKRTSTRGSESAEINNTDVAALMRELRELREMTKGLVSTRAVDDRSNRTEQSQNLGDRTVDMETETNPTETPETTAKQQAGYVSVTQAEAVRSTKDSISDFISAVVSKN